VFRLSLLRSHTKRCRESPQYNEKRMLKYHNNGDHWQVRPFTKNKPAHSKLELEHVRVLHRISASAAHQDTDSVTSVHQEMLNDVRNDQSSS
jgi:hypothetical protein